MRLGDGRYNSYAIYSCYVMLAEYKKAFEFDQSCAEVKELDAHNGGCGLPIRLIRKLK